VKHKRKTWAMGMLSSSLMTKHMYRWYIYNTHDTYIR